MNSEFANENNLKFICETYKEETGNLLNTDDAKLIWDWLQNLEISLTLFEMVVSGILFVTTKNGEVAYALTKEGKKYANELGIGENADGSIDPLNFMGED